MKVDTPVTQFDHPQSSAVPATPSCCCCCCCCLGTIVTTASLAAMSANTEAKVRYLPTGWPTFLAIMPQVVGLAAGLLLYSVGVPGLGSLALGVAAGFGTLLWAMMQAGVDGNAASGKAFKYTVVYCFIFPIELVGGGILLLFYVVPYLIVAGPVSALVITAQASRRRERLASHGPNYGPPPGTNYGLTPSPNYGLPPAPNYDPPPASDYGVPPAPTYEPPPSDRPTSGPTYEPPPSDRPTSGPTYEPPPSDRPTSGPTYESPPSGPPQTGPFFDPREQDDPDEPAL